MTKPLHDQAARDRFIAALDANFCVSAGAGVGKTTAIVRRVAELARRDSQDLSRLVVVTYTNAAAAELRTRAQELLLGDANAAALLPRIRQAFFGTIHSFCLKLVRDHGAELGVAPDSELLEEENEEEIWARFCESPTLDAVPLDPAGIEEVTRFLSFDELLKLARKIDPAQASRLIETTVPEPKPQFDFTAALNDDGGSRARESTRDNQEMLRRFLDDFSSGAAFLRLPEFSKGSGTFREAYQAAIFPFASWLDRQAARLAAQIALGYRDFRRELRLMTYADQIAWCRRLLESPAVLEQLRARDWIVLLDEAQDTDAAMFAILAEVTRPPGAPLGQWPDSRAEPPRPGRFCFVGDEQQSIFSSRSNLAVYRKYIDAFAAGSGGERLEFSVTMRCPQRVIGAVNAIFFQDDRMKQTHVSFRELHAKPDCVEGAAWLLPIEPLPGEKHAVADAFREECRQVATFIKQYGPSGLGVDKWNEIAILCPRHSWLRVAAEAFIDAGLPCRLVSQQRLQLELPERSWPAALLHVLLNPWDRFELIGVLREVFAVSDVEIADAHADNKPFTFLSARGLSPRLAAALDLLRALHAAAPPAGAFSLAQYVEHVLDATRLAARLAAAGQRNDALHRLRLDALRAEVDGTPLRAWVAHLVRALRRPAPQAAGVDDEILLLTSQKAKGQEWPVVIPLGLARTLFPAKIDYPRLEESADEISIHISKLTVTDAAKAPRETARREELQRLFYVMLTRAKSLLILPDSLRLYGKSNDSFLDLCRWAGGGCQALFTPPAALPGRK